MENSICCPLFTGDKEIIEPCIKHKCAWWDDEFKCCIIHSLSHIWSRLSAIEDELYTLNEILKEK